MSYQFKKQYMLISKTNRDFVFCNRCYEDVIRFADEMTHTISGESLLSQLNDFQLHLSSDLNITAEEEWNKTIFANKCTTPPYYINMFLRKYNLEII